MRNRFGETLVRLRMHCTVKINTQPDFAAPHILFINHNLSMLRSKILDDISLQIDRKYTKQAHFTLQFHLNNSFPVSEIQYNTSLFSTIRGYR